MRIAFDTTKRYVLFISEKRDEYIALDRFPAFIKPMIHHACHAVLPVCYNVIERMRERKQFRDMKIDPDVQAWLDSPFKLATLPESFYYHTEPVAFQEIALRYLYTLGSAGILLDPGMGKSKVVLDYIFLLTQMNMGRHLIVCPKPLLFVWEDEIAKHRPELSFHIVKTTEWEKEMDGIANNQVTIINYDKAVTFKHRLKEVCFDFMHVDEFLIKDPSTTRTKALTEISKSVKYRAGGSGTLINNSPSDAFSPIRYLQPSLFGGNFTSFLNEYSVKVPVRDASGARTDKSKIVAFKRVDEIKAALESCSIVMTKEKWLKSLPSKKFIDVSCQMSQEQKDAYYGLLKNYYVKVQGRDVEVDNALVMMSKLCQIASGFLYLYKETEKDVTKELLAEESKPSKKKKSDRQTIFFKEQPKITLLEQVLTEKLQGRRAIIWFNLEAEYELISKKLDELGHSYLTIKGGESQTGEKVRKFNTDNSIRWLVCQAKSVNYGITVLGSKLSDLEDQEIEVLPDIDTGIYTQVFYSFNFSLEVYLQQQDRIHRLGQTHDCEYYRLFVNSPIDMRIKQVLADKMSLRRDMLVDVAQTLLKEQDEVSISDL